MCTLTNLAQWAALAVSTASLCVAFAVWWTNREKLRLDLYNRRFDIYSRTLDLLHALETWNPTPSEIKSHSLQDSPNLDKAMGAFTKASRESQFLFEDESGIHKQLEQLHSAAIAIIGSKRDAETNLIGEDAARASMERVRIGCYRCPPRWRGQ
jgi:hypothetical protein